MKDKLFNLLLKLVNIISKVFTGIKFISVKVLEYLKLAVKKITLSIRTELITVFILCISLSIGIYFGSYLIVKKFNKRVMLDYTYSIERINKNIRNILSPLSSGTLSIKDKEAIQGIIDSNLYDDNTKVLVVYLDGNVLYKTANVETTKIDLKTVIKNVINDKKGFYMSIVGGMRVILSYNQHDEFANIYPIYFEEGLSYLIYKCIPEGEERIVGYKGELHIINPLVLSTIFFLFLFYFLTKRKINYIKEISQGLIYISKGNLEYRVAVKGKDELSSLAENINYMTKTLKNKIEEERRTENTKNELITNVSHDLRTPLTSIIGYLGLIKERKYENNQQLDEYSNIAFNKSEKLKILIDDLFEYTKVSNKGINLIKHKVVINELISQLTEEFVPIFAENNLELEKEFINEKIEISLDPDKTVRIFENLLINAVKYSYKPGKIKVKFYKDNDNAVVCIENKGENIPQQELQKLFDRFYKGDKSRTSQVVGSGLGLAIARRSVEMQGGSIWAECEDENIYFFVSFKY